MSEKLDRGYHTVYVPVEMWDQIQQELQNTVGTLESIQKAINDCHTSKDCDHKAVLDQIDVVLDPMITGLKDLITPI